MFIYREICYKPPLKQDDSPSKCIFIFLFLFWVLNKKNSQITKNLFGMNQSLVNSFIFIRLVFQSFKWRVVTVVINRRVNRWKRLFVRTAENDSRIRRRDEPIYAVKTASRAACPQCTSMAVENVHLEQ